MSTNPYESPTVAHDAADSPLSSRQSAMATLRTAFLILWVSAAFNYYMFDTYAISGGRIPFQLQAVFRTTNLILIGVGSALIWFFALRSLEVVGWAIRIVVARGVPTDRWDEALYISLRPAVYLAVPGAFLWALWVVCFYYLQFPFVIISWCVGVPAHILAAWLYIPLVIRWYQLARTERSSPRDGAER